MDHDYVVVSDRFGSAAAWPSNESLLAAGGFTAHFAHMRAFWNAQLADIAQISVPEPSLVDAYKSGFITTQITRSGNDLDTGVNGYESEFSHDVVGILTNLFTQGSYGDAHALLTEARNVVGAPGQYVDGLWTYSVPWAVYLLKTRDKAFVQQNFAIGGRVPPSQASKRPRTASRRTARDRWGRWRPRTTSTPRDTGPTTTSRPCSAWPPTATSRRRSATTAEASWASTQYASLLSATDAMLTQTIRQDHLDYLPCSLIQPNTANRCANPEDANWTSPIGNWAWEAALLGSPVSGPGLTMIDATYTYGFGRLHGLLPPDTTGGFPGDYYSSAYNAAQGAAGLASAHHRDQGILNFEFMVSNSQSGPLSWWESSSAPDPGSPWVGRHPSTGQGSSPHAWGIAGADKVLLDSLVAQQSNGSLVIGRGVPPAWLHRGTADLGDQLPHDLRPARRRQDRPPPAVRSRSRLSGAAPTGTRPLSVAVVCRQHCEHLGRDCRPGHRDRDPGTGCPPRHGHPAPGALIRIPAVLRRAKSGPFGSCAIGPPSLP